MCEQGTGQPGASSAVSQTGRVLCPPRAAPHGDQSHRALHVISSPRCARRCCSKIKRTWWKITWETIPSSRASSCRSSTRGVNLVLISETSQGRNTCWLSKQLGPTCCQRTACSLVVCLRLFPRVMECNILTFQLRKGKFWCVCQRLLQHLNP